MGIQALPYTSVLAQFGGDATGDIYYRGAAGTLTKLAIGTAAQVLTVNAGLPAWATVAAAAVGGSTGQMQFNNAGAFGGTVAIVYATTVVHQTITAQGATIVCGVDKGAPGQTANLREWQNSAGTVLAAVNSAGKVGIGTANPTNIVSLGNAQNQKIWIENTDNLTAGRSLTISSASTVNTSPSSDPTFNPLSQTTRGWISMTTAPNGNVYACVYSGDIYMQTNGVGNFVALSQTTRLWYGMTATANGNVYACVYSGDIYMQVNFAGGTPNLDGGALILSSGVGKGNAASTISFKTGTTTTTGTDLQVLSEKMTILGSGNVGIGTATPNSNAILDVISTTKAFMPPRMTTAQRDAIASPTAGMIVFNSTTGKINIYTTAWEVVTST
jgi:hypothetical protein